MNTAAHVVNILRKDLRAHVLELGLLFLLNIALVFVATQTWPETVASDIGPSAGFAELVLQIALIVIWALMIAQVMQAETPTGKAAYWLTRPLSRLVVPVAKTAFVLLAVHLPTFVAQLVIVTASGVPLSVGQLLVNQLVFLVYWSLPMMLVASLTRSLAHFVFAVVAFGTLMLLMQGVILRSAGFAEFASNLLDPIPLELASWMLALALVAGGAIFWQYMKRRTLTIASCCVGVLIVLFLIAASIPEKVEHWARSLLLPTPTASPAFSFRASADRSVSNDNAPRLIREIALPLEVSGMEGVEILRMQARIRTIGPPEQTFTNVAWLRRSADGYWADVYVPTQFYEGEASVRIEIFLMEYEIQDSVAIPLDGTPAIVDGRAQCGVVSGPDASGGTNSSFHCRSAFGWSDWLMDGAQPALLATRSYLPFRFSMNPIVTKRVISTSIPEAALMSPLASVTRVPSGYARHVVEIDSIRLEDWLSQ